MPSMTVAWRFASSPSPLPESGIDSLSHSPPGTGIISGRPILAPALFLLPLSFVFSFEPITIESIPTFFDPESALMIKRITTLTVNPTIDINTRVEKVRADEKLRCHRPRREPGGGGLNVSRAILRLGGSSRALYLRGGPTGKMLEEILTEEGLEQDPIGSKDWTRENFHILEEASGDQYRFGMPGPRIREEEWQGCLQRIADLEPAPHYLVASGSLAREMPDDFYARLARIAAEIDARLIVDTSGPALQHALEAGPFLIKPNRSEFEALIGEDLSDADALRTAARDLIAKSSLSMVLISLGSQGALLVTDQEADSIEAPQVEARSKIGAGDSMVAGTVLGLARGLDPKMAARFGVAAGAAAVLTEGTELCRREDTERLFEQFRPS